MSYRALPAPVDVLLGLALGGLALVEIWVEPVFQTGIPGPRLPLTLLMLVAAVAVVCRTVLPLPSAAAFAATTLAVGAVGDPDQAAFELALGAMLIGHAVGRQESTARSVAGLAVLLTAGVGYAAFTYDAGDDPTDVVVPLTFVAAAWVVGREVQRHRILAEGSERARRAADAVQEARVEAATAGERARIARELHDVVAHGVSVMGLEAAAVRAGLDAGRPEPTAAADALCRIEDLGRETLVELHRMLAVLRSDAAEATRDPARGIADLAALCADGAEPPVELAITGDDLPLPAATELAAYRIVQEALTNARRHAAAGVVRVAVERAPGELRIEVSDDGRGAPADWHPGHGLIGMRERVTAHGGTLHAGPAGTGFLVRAVLPIGGTA